MSDATTNRPTVLVVDDSRLMRVAARKILKQDFEILEAEDGEIAWDRLQSAPEIALVMSDLSMPNLDGLGLLKKIRESSHAHLKELPVIIVTGAEDDDGSKKIALSAGASDFITKPFDSVQLLARAKAQVRQQRTQQALQHSETSNQHLQQQSHIDQLTGLGNQRAFLSHLEEDLSYAIRHRTELTVLLIRVEKYKVMFLRRGKQVAETTLRSLGQLLTAGRRREDMVARVGIDTFGILLPSAGLPGANRVAQQLREAIDQHDFSIDSEPVPVSVSIGASSDTINTATTASMLLAEANAALDGDHDTDATSGPNAVSAESGAQPPLPPAPGTAAHVVEAAEPVTTPPAEPVLEARDAPDTPVQPTLGTGESSPPAAETVYARPEPSLATDVIQALQALSGDAHPALDADQMVQAIIPLLESWNRTHNGRHDAIIEQLKSALRASASTAPVAQAAAGISPESA